MGIWGPIISGGLSLLGGALSGSGQRDAAKAQNNQMAWLYNPGRINHAATEHLFPWLGNIQRNRRPSTNPFYQQMFDLAMNPGYIDPALMNLSYTQAARGARNNLGRLQGMLGRSNMSGGLGNAYALANLGGLNATRANLAQQYALWREQQRRSDLQYIQSQFGQAQQTAAGLAGGQAQQYITPTPWSSIMGNAITGGLAAYGSMPQYGQYGGAGTGNAGMQSTIQTGNPDPFGWQQTYRIG